MKKTLVESTSDYICDRIRYNICMHVNSSIVESTSCHLYRHVIACISFPLMAVTLSADFSTCNFCNFLRNKNERIVISNKVAYVMLLLFIIALLNIIFTAICKIVLQLYNYI